MRDGRRGADTAGPRAVDTQGHYGITREPAHVVIEVGGHSPWVSELLEGLGHRVTIANARRVKLISASDNKTDEHNAELLARLGRADARLLAPMVHRSSALQADLAIAKARDTLVATRTKLVNHVRGTVKSFGERLPKCSSSSFGRHTRALIPAALEAALAPVYETIAKLDEQIRAQDKLIEGKAEANPDVAVLEQVDGVGALTALVYMLTLEDKDRFASSRMAGAFLGLRPRKQKSGNDDPQLRITKAGEARATLFAMGRVAPIPPPGFDEMSVEDKIDYVQELWDRIAADQSAVPVPEWHREVLEERLADVRANPDQGRPWEEVEADLSKRRR